MPKIRFTVVVAGAVFALACQDSTPPITSPLAALRSSADSIFDVPATEVTLPPRPRPFDTDDDALESAIQNGGGLAVVAFKDPASPRFREVGGRRAAVPAHRTREAVAMLRTAGANVLQVYGISAMAYVRLPRGTSAALRRSPLVDFVEPVPSGRTNKSLISLSAMPSRAGSVTPAGRVLLGQTVPWGVTMVHAPSAWPLTRGASAKVMIMSSGIDAHPDLPVIPVGNCGGYFNSCSSRYANGTIFAGIVAALDNSIGVVGVAPGVQGSNLYSWRIYNDSAAIDWNLYLSGLNSAPQMGIKVVLTDVVYWPSWQPDATAIAAAWAAGTIVVAGVGDAAAPKTDIYPASYLNVVGVAGVRDDGTSASSATPGCTIYPGSNHGPMVDLAAPYWAYSTGNTETGVPNYVDTKADLGWCTNDLASAHVAGVIALMQDRYPTWTPAQIVQQLIGTASQASSRDDYLGYGIPNAVLASGGLPLTNSIYAQPPWYYAQPSGGYPPYTYLWEVCLWNCYGGNAPAASGGVGPNRPVGGWQFLSNNPSVYWTSSGSILRSTVTDSHNQQAVDTYTVP